MITNVLPPFLWFTVYMLNTVINFLFKNFITLWCDLAKTVNTATV